MGAGDGLHGATPAFQSDGSVDNSVDSICRLALSFILKQPKPIKLDLFILEAIDDLLLDVQDKPKSIQDLNKARNAIEDSIDDLLWLDDVRLNPGSVSLEDERNGKTVFQEEEKATVNL